MKAGEILIEVNGLTIDKLTYFVRSGYIKPKKIKRESLYYNDFSSDDLEIIKRAWKYITSYDMKTRSAFERAIKENKNPQLDLL